MTLAQEGKEYNGRVRTEVVGGGKNGFPQLLSSSQPVKLTLHHVAFVRAASKRSIYVNGNEVLSASSSGDFKDWANYRLVLGNELTGSRAWSGTFFLVAVYSKALSSDELKQNFTAGKNAP